MGAAVTYMCTALYGTNKAGKLKCDPDGYYDIVLGALNYYNSQGAFYALDPAKSLFDSSSILQRRIAKGVLNGEYQHPVQLPGMSNKDYLVRVLKIDEKMVSHHIKEVYIDSETAKDKDGKPVVMIRGRVKPKGPYADPLAASLENDKENVYFSIRSLTDDLLDTRSGEIIKNLLEIITWDHVNEGGIDIACKYSTPTLETIQETRFSRDNILLAKNASLALEGIGVEDDRSDVKRVADHVERIYQRGAIKESKLILPPAARW